MLTGLWKIWNDVRTNVIKSHLIKHELVFHFEHELSFELAPKGHLFGNAASLKVREPLDRQMRPLVKIGLFTSGRISNLIHDFHEFSLACCSREGPNGLAEACRGEYSQVVDGTRIKPAKGIPFPQWAWAVTGSNLQLPQDFEGRFLEQFIWKRARL